MATSKKVAPSEQVTLTISRTEATELLAMLKHTEELVNAVQPRQTQNFLGGLIRKIKRAAGKSVKGRT